MTQSPLERVTVAVELDNAVHGDWDDVALCLHSIGHALARAATERPLSFDVVMLADEQPSAERAGGEIRSAAAGAVADVEVRLLPKATYFEKKAAAAVEATTELVLFADCDCWYEPEWASRLIKAFDDPAVQLASGRSFARTDGSTPKQRAASLVWMFPVDRAEDPRRAPQVRYANSFAVRAQLMRDVPIRDFDAYRGQGHDWLRNVDEKGVRSVFVESARAFHRQADGISALVEQAWREGVDRDIDLRLKGRGLGQRLVRVLPGVGRSIGRGARILAVTPPPAGSGHVRLRATGYLVAFHLARGAGQASSCLRGKAPFSGDVGSGR